MGQTPENPVREVSSVRPGRQLRALLEVARAAGREQRLDRQTRIVLDEVVRVLGADRGLLLFERPGASTRVLEGRTSAGQSFEAGDRDLAKLLSRVSEARVALHQDPGLARGLAIPKTHVLVVPLQLHDRPCGALFVERVAGPPFGPTEHDLVNTLAPQVPAALELARLLEEREQLETDLRQAQRMEAVGQLASGIAHDFNNMLTAIRSALELLRGSDDEADREESIETIFAAYERAAELTAQLLAVSRRQVPETEVLDIGAAVETLEGIVRRLAGASIRVEIRIPDEPVNVRTDRSALERAIVNLAVNARDAMPDGGHLRIAVDAVTLPGAKVPHGGARAQTHARIEVTDDGTGMPPELRDKIFEPFFTTKDFGRGTGLGLPSVYGFVKQAGGRIEVQSELGQGTTVLIFLPTSSDAPIVVAHEPSAPRGGPSILVADDDPLVRRSMASALTHQGYVVLEAPNGQAALDLIQEEGAVDLVVADVVMPIMSGPELARQLARAGIAIPILFVSGYPDAELVEQGVMDEGVEFLRKPFATAELLARIRALLPGPGATLGG